MTNYQLYRVRISSLEAMSALVILLYTTILIGCGDNKDVANCPMGSESCDCTEGGGCDDGLTCYSEKCVKVDDVSPGDDGGIRDNRDGGDHDDGSVVDEGDGGNDADSTTGNLVNCTDGWCCFEIVSSDCSRKEICGWSEYFACTDDPGDICSGHPDTIYCPNNIASLPTWFYENECVIDWLEGEADSDPEIPYYIYISYKCPVEGLNANKSGAFETPWSDEEEISCNFLSEPEPELREVECTPPDAGNGNGGAGGSEPEPECTSDSDCSSREVCSSNRCIDVECTSDSHCGSCSRCSSNSCRSCGYGPYGCYC